MYISYSNEIYDHFEKLSELYEKIKAKAIKQNQTHKIEILKVEELIIEKKRNFNKVLKNSVKFKMEACHDLLPTNTPPLEYLKNFIQTINLPYESICIELDENILGANQDTPLVIIAQQEEDEISIYALTKFNNEWNYLHSVSEDNLVYAVINKDTFDGYILGLDALVSHESRNQISNWMNKVAIRSVCNLLCALSCSNTRIDNSPYPPSNTKNKLRRSKNKLPLFEFKILTVDTSKSPTQKDSNSSNTGKHASPRVHLRRGHIRKLPDKNVWVNSCVVGEKKNGIIQKDYLVK